MSDEKQPDLPGLSVERPVSGGPIHGIENLMNAPPLEWGEPPLPGLTGSAVGDPAPALHGDGVSQDRGQAKQTRKSRSKTAQKPSTKDVDDVTGQATVVSKPPRKRAVSTKHALAVDQARPVETNEPASAAPAVKSVRRLRKAPAEPAAAQEIGPNKTTQTSSAKDGVPPITEEAIAFLRNPGAPPADILKLGADSRAFVQYHITNLQRVEAHSQVTRRALNATAPKFSPQFEKVADALVARLAKRGAIAATPTLDSGAVASAERSNANFAPKSSVTYVRRPVAVQMGKMEFGSKAVASALASKKMRTGGATDIAKPTDAKAVNDQMENVIERGTPRERLERPLLARSDTLQPAVQSGPLVTDITSGFGKRVLRTMGGAAQATAVWLQNKAEGVSSPAASPATPPHTKRAAGKPLMSNGDISTSVPAAVAQRFLKVEQNYYFPDKTHAFSDHGNKLATRASHPEVVRSLVEIAKARGWDSITVKGSDDFRRSAWMEAAQVGLQVAGYSPTTLDLAELAQRPVRNAVEKGAVTARLSKATKSAGAQTVPEPIPATGATSRKPTTTSKHNGNEPNPQLVAKARSFESDNPAFVVKKHPDVAPGYGIVDAAKKFAEANLPESAREEFIRLARRHVVQKIITGEHIKGPQIYLSPEKVKDEPVQGGVSAQGSRDEGKSPRAKDVARER